MSKDAHGNDFCQDCTYSFNGVLDDYCYNHTNDALRKQNQELTDDRRDRSKQHQTDARIWQIERDKLRSEIIKLEKVVNAARELVFGKSSDSVDTDEYPDLEKALRELNG